MTADRVVLGRILRAHGVRGAVLLRSDPAVVDVLRPGVTLFVEPRPGTGRPSYTVRRATRHRAGAVLELEGLGDRDAAEALAACDVTAARDVLPRPLEGEYYECDLVGSVVERADGEVLGTLVEVLATGANDVWVVRSSGGEELLVPAVAHAVLEVDAARRRVVIDPASVTSAGERP